MTVSFQYGVSDIFFPALRAQGIECIRFRAAQDLSPDADVIFFRANFTFDRTVIDSLPRLKLAALVSTGIDKVDVSALEERGVQFVTGEGANAAAVCDYVIQALSIAGIDAQQHRVGVVGAGRIGHRVLQVLRNSNIAATYYDPHLPEPGSLAEVLRCDFVTFHVPLTHETRGILSAAYFSDVNRPMRIIQTSRGELWDREFYRELVNHPYLKILAQDVYPDEPPSVADVVRAQISTPHIAGYSTRGRLGGIVRGIEALIPNFSAAGLWPLSKAWSLEDESQAFKGQALAFNALRDNYGWRKEFSEYTEEESHDFLQRYPKARSFKIFLQ